MKNAASSRVKALFFRRERRRAFERLPEGLITLLISLFCVIFGLLGIASSGRYFVGGLALILYGCARSAFCAKDFLDRREARREEHEARARRAAQLQVRKDRHSEEKLKRKRDAETEKRAAESAKRALAELHELERTRSRRQEMVRRSQDAMIEQEVKRILALDDESLIAEVVLLFGSKGLFPVSGAPEASSSLILKTENSFETCTVKCVPRSKKAEETDIEALEQARIGSHSSEAYLISPAGFSANAVRRSAELSITLVEAHLLANWKLRAAQLHAP